MDLLTNNIIVKGGWVMVPIILGSIIAFGLAIERGMMLWRIRLNIKKFSDEIYYCAQNGDLKRARALCDAVLHPIGRVFSACLDHWGEDPLEVERIMEHAGNEEATLLEKNMNLFMVIVGVEPMLGFLGTILGLIQAFMEWESHAASITVDRLAAGIYQAMITTGGGLLVAIPFYVIYNIYTSKINGVMRDMNHYGEVLLRIMKNTPSRKRK